MTPLPTSLSSAMTARFVDISLDCLHREYPNVVQHVMNSDADALPPRQMKPAFYGCFDWHSAVHNHWALIRLLRVFPEAGWSEKVLAALSQSFTPENIQGELAYISDPSRTRFEIPYGIAWLLQLDRELLECGQVEPYCSWKTILAPLVELGRERFGSWLKMLPVPIRSGEHSQSAFAMGLVHDWAVLSRDDELRRLIDTKAKQFYLTDLPWPFWIEPSAYDFLSPGLGAADLLRRIMDGEEYENWLQQFLPAGQILAETEWLPPVTCADPSEGKLSHWEGLNLSRAWMLEAIAAGCGNARLSIPLGELAARHRDAGLSSLTGEHYAGAHWLVSFAVYLMTSRWRPGRKRT